MFRGLATTLLGLIIAGFVAAMFVVPLDQMMSNLKTYVPLLPHLSPLVGHVVFALSIMAAAILLGWGIINLSSQRSDGEETPQRVPLTDLRQWAIDAGWNADIHAVAIGDNDFWTFSTRLRQAAVDGKITFWGRKYDYDIPAYLADTKPLLLIPAQHFDDHNFDVVELATAQNYDIFTGEFAVMRSAQHGKIYRDPHVDRDQARTWLREEGHPPEPCSIAISVKKTAPKIGDYEPIVALTITNATKGDLDRCLVQLEQLSGLHPPRMPMPLVLRTDGQIRNSRHGRFTL